MSVNPRRLAIAALLPGLLLLWVLLQRDAGITEHAETHTSNPLPASFPPAASGSTASWSSQPQPAADHQGRTAAGPEPAVDTWDGAAFAPSLAGTEIDGELLADAQGNLIIGIGIKDFFDYFFSVVGQRSVEDVIAEVERQIRARLPAAAASQALQIMQDYIAYQEQMSALMQSPLLPAAQQDYRYYADTMAATFEQLKQLRRQYFSPDLVDAFFGLEEAYGEYAVRTLQIQADDALGDEEKVERIRALESLLPEQMVNAERLAMARAAAADEARSLFEAGESADKVRDALATQFDTATTEEIYRFYESERRWQQRMTTYLSEVAQLQQSRLAPADLDQARAALQGKHFAVDELARVAAEEAILRKISPRGDS